VLLVVFAIRRYGLALNVTDSMPLGLYHIQSVALPVASGTIVQTCLPSEIASVGLARKYLLTGNCASGTTPVLKIVVGVAGDRIDVSDRRITINGHALRGSATAASDRNGRPLARFPRGVVRLVAGQIWLWTPNPASWDSRYYGPISERLVLARATLLLPLGSWPYAAMRSAVLRTP
jgi:conjugative transfer signal peptidase TraF